MSGTDQTLFRRSMMDPTAPVPTSLTDGAGRPAGRRFSVYRNNVAVGLTDALIDGFPACYAVLGDEMFRGMAAVYLRQHPPSSPLMARFGGDLPGFLDDAPQMANMRWIGDLARLECAIRDCYHAADTDLNAAQSATQIPPETLGDTRFSLAPSLRVLRSDWPVLSIWRRALNPEAPQAELAPEDVLILRPGFDPVPSLLQPGDAVFLSALSAGETLTDAAAAAVANHEDHDPTQILTQLIQSSALIPISEALT